VYVSRHRDGSYDWWTARVYTYAYDDTCDDSELATEGALDQLPD
jgi:hypothetical protein